MVLLLAASLMLACATEAPVDEPGTAVLPAVPTAAPEPGLIDSGFPPAVAGEDGWDFEQRLSADLTGDGQPEVAVLTARVELVRGQPAWDDGQPWQVYVESTGGSRTYLYAQRLQLGTLTMRISQPDSTHLPTVILLEQLPERLRIIEVNYPTASGAPRALVQFERRLDARGDVAEH